MSCPSPIVLSMYVDRELAAAEAHDVDRHLSTCPKCRARVAALNAETAELRAALATAGELTAVPRFARPLRVRDVCAFGAAAAGIALFATAVWSAVVTTVPAGLAWLNPFGLGGLLDLAINFIVNVSFEGTTMFSSIIDIAAVLALVTILAWPLLAAYKSRAGTALALSVLMLAIVVPSLGHAFEIRRGDVTTVAAGETVDDTLIAIGQSVVIDGNVNGDLIAFARRVTVSGHVTGDIIGGAETVSIEGAVDGNVFGFGRAVTLGESAIGHNVYGFGRDVTIGREAGIGGNAATFANDADVSGRVGLDLMSFANTLSLSGRVARNVDAYGNEITVVPPGNVVGNLTAHVSATDKLKIADGATVGGQVKTDLREAPRAQRSPYLTTSFYVRQIIRLGAAFLTGALLLWIFPGLRTLSIGSGADAVKTGVTGLVTAVMLPLVALIACITIFGIPLGIVGFVVWLLGLYFAKILIAQVIGRALFKSPIGYPHYAATLLSGLVIVIIAVNIPWVGWLANVVLTCVGLGVLALYAAGLRERAAEF